jgi:hypothetical protein
MFCNRDASGECGASMGAVVCLKKGAGSTFSRAAGGRVRDGRDPQTRRAQRLHLDFSDKTGGDDAEDRLRR